MKKHAYMIMAHNEWGILEKLIKSLDSDNIDFYIHIDKKVKNFDFYRCERLCKKSKITFVDRIDVRWGSDSQIKCELLLLETTIKKEYDYYHLLSGVDMPLKSIDVINEFFENTNKNYIKKNDEINDNFLKGLRQNFYLQQYVGRGKTFKEKFFKVIQRGLVLIQKTFKVDRVKKSNLNYYKGDQWFSITHQMASYIVENRSLIQKYFYHSYLADEVFITTLAYNSPYANNIENNSLRYIDWERGKPYTFTKDDYSDLINSDMLFARKFNNVVDNEIVNILYESINGDKL